MKKKGLIISTVVMAVVLIASLTTATYAWFSATSSTSIKGFDVKVGAGSDVSIGFVADNAYDADNTIAQCVTDAVNWTGTAWEGTPGISKNLTPSFYIGADGVLSQAVGMSTVEEANVTTATESNTGFWNIASGKTPISANKGVDGAFTAPRKAIENGTTEAVGDYIHFVLAVQPNKVLTTNELYIIVRSEGLATIGMSAAVHVAYRIGAATEWTDVDVFGSYTQGTPKATPTVTLPVDVANVGTKNQEISAAAMYKIADGDTATGKGGLDLEPNTDGKVNQIEIVVYIAGKDADCIDAATGVNTKVDFFFNTVAATA